MGSASSFLPYSCLLPFPKDAPSTLGHAVEAWHLPKHLFPCSKDGCACDQQAGITVSCFIKPHFRSHTMMPGPSKWQPAYLFIFDGSNRKVQMGKHKGGIEKCVITSVLLNFAGQSRRYAPTQRRWYGHCQGSKQVSKRACEPSSAVQDAVLSLHVGSPCMDFHMNKDPILLTLHFPISPCVSSIIPFSNLSILCTCIL